MGWNMPKTQHDNSKNSEMERFICRLPSGAVYLSTRQYHRGYCVLQAEPEVESINHLDLQKQAEFFADMTHIGEAIMQVTGAYRINYMILGNSLPLLHAHIIPRHDFEPEELKHELPTTNPAFDDEAYAFDAARDGELMEEIRELLGCVEG
jgi:diadenosine tetraphosphate (Ap4A) HIT family hydrolase